mmetsp:Transcript_13621/g.22241  ORF Transcript_13621/g.22241 Transcript_13621/m.22241 type:complete len:171 (+) Transcript_13621:1379-1891(+)
MFHQIASRATTSRCGLLHMISRGFSASSVITTNGDGSWLGTTGQVLEGKEVARVQGCVQQREESGVAAEVFAGALSQSLHASLCAAVKRDDPPAEVRDQIKFCVEIESWVDEEKERPDLLCNMRILCYGIQAPNNKIHYIVTEALGSNAMYPMVESRCKSSTVSSSYSIW